MQAAKDLQKKVTPRGFTAAPVPSCYEQRVIAIMILVGFDLETLKSEWSEARPKYFVSDRFDFINVHQLFLQLPHELNPPASVGTSSGLKP
jgi:hypothetical protein